MCHRASPTAAAPFDCLYAKEREKKRDTGNFREASAFYLRKSCMRRAHTHLYFIVISLVFLSFFSSSRLSCSKKKERITIAARSSNNKMAPTAGETQAPGWLPCVTQFNSSRMRGSCCSSASKESLPIHLYVFFFSKNFL